MKFEMLARRWVHHLDIESDRAYRVWENRFWPDLPACLWGIGATASRLAAVLSSFASIAAQAIASTAAKTASPWWLLSAGRQVQPRQERDIAKAQHIVTLLKE
jgi:hypothetical protein